jgi:hypothetical protein
MVMGNSLLAQINLAASSVHCVLNVTPKDVFHYTMVDKSIYIFNSDTLINDITYNTLKQTIVQRTE